jgi:uncharacterized protein (UPF0261 family)
LKPAVVFIATYDTKGAESEYIKEKILSYGVNCLTVDVGVKSATEFSPDVGLEKLCEGAKQSAGEIRAMKRGEAIAEVSALAETFVKNLYLEGKVHALIGIGGAGGTQLATQAMRALPFGLPKLMLSTLASGNTRWYLEDSDISLFPSVADVAGLNGVTRLVFSRFASYAAQGALWYFREFSDFKKSLEDRTIRRVSQTMYGTTTVGVSKARKRLEDKGFETLVFHASGAGGRSMENFIRDGVVQGVLDMTLAEIGAHLAGALHDAGPGRLDAAVEKAVPCVLVPGAADTVVLPPISALPDKFRGRTLNFHNPTMTTMRTNVNECKAIGEFIVRKMQRAKVPVKIFLPRGGLSSIDKPGEIFYFPEANEALFETLKNGLKENTNVEIIEDKRHLYDEGFGEDAADLLIGMM